MPGLPAVLPPRHRFEQFKGLRLPGLCASGSAAPRFTNSQASPPTFLIAVALREARSRRDRSRGRSTLHSLSSADPVRKQPIDGLRVCEGQRG